MVEQFVNVLTKLLLNKKEGNYDAACDDIDTAFTTLMGLDYNFIKELSAEKTISLLQISKNQSEVNFKCVIIGKLTKEKADIDKLKYNSIQTGDYYKALKLLLEGIINNNNPELNLSNYYPDVKEIVNVLGNDFPDGTRFSLFKFYKLTGDYDKAENELFRLKEINYPDIYEEGISFFNYLKSLTNKELQQGNLSREEVEEGLSDFKK
jgi:tetratricopeptide (TPR) repeat protein